eukprot:CAMPEP_0172519230 /NCGR_PEP_ID=MMETSP1066-20121228/291294_1 /TAXON_ID=671091 /ORGANISM="Coscinodiscus wailesii, Strain CCMP2513" /LENGTH=54 /DNA_ID=CAMNT_0013301777 /DNA_START=871 /DNA_END=1032 /DNA_ORIENTATION=-
MSVDKSDAHGRLFNVNTSAFMAYSQTPGENEKASAAERHGKKVDNGIVVVDGTS